MAELPTRQTLLMRLKDRHDDQSWEDFSHYYRRYLFAIVIAMNVRHQDQDDLVQQVMLKAWKSLPEFEYEPGKGRFRSWLGTVTRNTVRTFLTKKTTKRENIAHLEAMEAQEAKLTDSDLEILTEKEWMRHVAELAWENISPALSEKVRDVFLAYQECEGDIAATALKAEVAENTVYIYSKRVRKKLYREIIRLEHELS
ncbi:MAG: RNA polymerase sigma factor [Lentisphaeraceae bacterium]|nr:RNA polymerase sigma factor [Lentisphaeraceae bacterium]